MSRRTSIASILIALAACVGLFVFIMSDPGESVTGSPAEETGPALGPTTSIRGPDPVANSEAGLIKTTAYEEEDLEGLATSGRSYAVLVVDEGDRPVEGASIEVLLSRQRDQGRGFMPFMEDREERSDRAVRKAVTLTDGQAIIESLPRRALRVRATKGLASGFTRFDPLDDAEEGLPEGVDMKVVLRPAKPVEIKVVDAGGNAAPAIAVTIQAIQEEESDRGDRRRPGRGRDRGGRTGRGRPRTLWSSSPEGVVSLHLTPEDGELYEAKELALEARIWGGESVRKETRPKLGEVTKVEIEIPFTVTLDITLVDPAEKRIGETADLIWTITSETPNADRNDRGDRWGRWRGRTGFRRVPEGRLVVGGFPLGAKVNFTANERTREGGSKEVLLPTNAKRMDVAVPVGGKQPLVVAQLLEQNGEPLGRERISYRVEYPSEERAAPGQGSERDRMRRFARMRGSTARVDEMGLIAIPVDSTKAGTIRLQRPGQIGGWFGRAGGRRGRGMNPSGDNANRRDDTALAVMDFPALDAGTRHDAGKIKVDRGPILAAGIVVDHEKKPQEAMRVRQQASREGRGGRFGRGFPGGSSRPAVTGKDGRFVIYAEAEDGVTYSLTAARGSRSSRPTKITPGAQDIVLTVIETGGLKGTVKLSDPSLGLTPTIRARLQSESEDRRAWKRGRVDQKQGTFELRNLLPGTYDLEVQISGKKDLEITGIEVPSGEVVAPDSLQGLVVGLGFIRAEITVVNPAGEPVRRASVAIRRLEADTGNRNDRGRRRGGDIGNTSTRADGKASIVFRPGEAPYEVRVRARNHAPWSQANPAFPLRVMLEPPRVLTLNWTAALPAMADERATWRLMLLDQKMDLQDSEEADAMRRMMRWFRNQRGSKTVRPGERTASFENIEEGRRWVYIMPGFSRGGGGPGRRGRPTFSTPVLAGEVTIPPGTADVTSSITLDPEALRTAFPDAFKTGQ